MDCNIQNKDLVSIIHITWELQLNETLEKLRDLYNAGVIVYAKIRSDEKSNDGFIPTIHMIMRFNKRRSILQIRNYFPNAKLEK